MKRTCSRIMPAALIWVAGVSAGADLGSVTEMCNGCHGADGVSEWTDMPTIGGIDEFVHSEALFIYRDNARPCVDSEFRRGDTSRDATNMCEVVADMSDDDIEQIAAVYAALPFVPAVQDFDAELAAAGEQVHEQECGRCHTDGGSNPEDEASILAGQWRGYLERTFAEYRSGERDQPPRMEQAMDGLSDDELQSLLHYYGSRQ